MTSCCGAAAFAARRHAMDPQRRFLNKFLDEVLAGVAGAEEEGGGEDEAWEVVG